MKWWSYACLVLCVALGVCLTACDDDAHEGEYPLPEGQGAMIIGLESQAEVTDLTLYLFGSDGTAVLCETYDNPRELASGYIPVPAGSYTLVIVANGDPADTKVEPLPEETTIPDLVEWLKAHAADFPYMLTASEQVEVASGDIERLHLVLTDGTCLGLTCRLTRPPVLAVKASRCAAWRRSIRLARATAYTAAYRSAPCRRTAHSWPNSP